MKTKQIVFTDVGKAELLATDCEMPKEGEVLISLVYSTISCGTERANLMGDKNVNGALSADDTPMFPRYCGYCSSGTVIAVGDGVTKFSVGDKVVCRGGSHKKNMVLGQNNVTKIADGVSVQEAAMVYISTFSIAGVRKTRLEIGESAVVMGLGILGLFAVQFLKAAGAVPIIAVDPVADRRSLALKFGADYALDPTDSDFAEKVIKLTDGGANAAIEVAGVGAALDSVLDCMARFGRVALLGCTRDKNFTIDYYRKVHFPGVSLVGAHTVARPCFESSPGYWTSEDDTKAIMKLIAGGRVNFKDMIFETHEPQSAPEVYHRLATDRNFPVCVQFDWTKMEDCI